MKLLSTLLFFVMLGVSSGSMASAESVPQQMIRDTTERLIERFKQQEVLIREHPERLYELVVDIVMPSFDFWRMSRWVLGKYWRKASDQQRAHFVTEFQQMLVRTYSNALLEYKGQTLVFMPMKPSSKKDEVVVHVEIEQAGAFPIPLAYKLYQVNGEWKIFDVKIDEISMVANYRTTFGSEIRRHGLDWLIHKLNTNNTKKN